MSPTTTPDVRPRIIQGGMGVGVSGWKLARAVASRGQLGVVSGTALDVIMIRRLQRGDAGGHVRRALAEFPNRQVAEAILAEYFVVGGKADRRPYIAKPLIGQRLDTELCGLLAASSFVEVTLAKQGHDGQVGINFLNKIQTPLLPSLYGAMLAGVDVVIVGAGIPLEVPGLLDRLSRHESVSLDLPVRAGRAGATCTVTFDPAVLGMRSVALRRPRFFPVISSVTLAKVMVGKCPGGVDGLIIEAPSAGGHNAPPRGRAPLSERGEPVYGPRDEVDLAAIRDLGVPFWLAGSRGSPEQLEAALADGATGVQVGTLFAFCRESGMRTEIKQTMVDRCQTEPPRIFTDPLASPTGFPFKVVPLEGSMSEAPLYDQRPRQCDLGYLREAYERPDGSIDWRCAAELPDTYVKKGGDRAQTVGRKCLCNGLLATIGLAQTRADGWTEPPLVTCGDTLDGVRRVVACSRRNYTAADVIDFLLTPEMADAMA